MLGVRLGTPLMWATDPPAHPPGVEAATRVVRLEVSVAGESLTGWAQDDRGAGQRFDGRLGLLAAIDMLVAGPASETGPGDAERPGAADGTP